MKGEKISRGSPVAGPTGSTWALERSDERRAQGTVPKTGGHRPPRPVLWHVHLELLFNPARDLKFSSVGPYDVLEIAASRSFGSVVRVGSVLPQRGRACGFCGALLLCLLRVRCGPLSLLLLLRACLRPGSTAMPLHVVAPTLSTSRASCVLHSPLFRVRRSLFVPSSRDDLERHAHQVD